MVRPKLDHKRAVIFADIILPIAGPCYTFSVGEDLAAEVVVGSAVSVQFGARKIVGGIVRTVHEQRPPYKTIKPLLGLLFPRPIVSPEQMRLWEWMADYYMCTLGEVMRAALPSMLKPAGFTAEEFAAGEFRERTVRIVALSPTIPDEEQLGEACEKLHRRAPKMYAALVEICEKLDGRLFGGEVPRRALNADTPALAALQKKGIIVITEQALQERSYSKQLPPSLCHTSPEGDCRGSVDELARCETANSVHLPELSAAQQTALDGLREALKGREAALLFGVPASGKSEVSFHAIASTLARGRDVLLLLPEISLTTQFAKRVKNVFGDRVVLYHSGLTDRRRAETYIRLVRSEVGRGEGSLIVGTRSAIFLPMPHLGLVVVDEEQDTSYKQHDPAPRYNARDAAVVLAGFHPGAKVILASATPSLETWMNCLSGKYGLVELSERYGDTLPPRVTISDTIRSAKRGERRSHFNKELLDRIGAALERGRQAILFQNRRGIAPFVECPDCGFVPRCEHCGIPMTVHRSTLRCHYCGASRPVPSVCPACTGGNLTTRGFGTEKIEEELSRLFPSARIARLDRDSATSERAYSRIINDFEHGATDILVGTQMVTKGLDFAEVALVGVLNADNLVNHPDFRASERAYSLIAQVAGRAGRRAERGEVVIQTATPESPLIDLAATGDYRRMASGMLVERARYGYPPYSRLISIMLRHADRTTLNSAAERFGELLRPTFGMQLLGPEAPVTEKIKGEYALVYLLKVPRGGQSKPLSEVREILRKAMAELLADPAFRRVSITPNVDPQ